MGDAHPPAPGRQDLDGEAAGPDLAVDGGRQGELVVGAVVGGAERGDGVGQRVGQGRVQTPHVHGDGCGLRQGTGGGAQTAGGGRLDPLDLVEAGQPAVDDAAEGTRHRAPARRGGREGPGDQGGQVGGSPEAEPLDQRVHGLGAVVVVRVHRDGRGRARGEAPRHRVGRAPRATPAGVGVGLLHHRDGQGRAGRDVVDDLGPHRGADHQDDVADPGGGGVGDGVVDQGRVAGADRRDLLEGAVAPAHARSQHEEGGWPHGHRPYRPGRVGPACDFPLEGADRRPVGSPDPHGPATSRILITITPMEGTHAQRSGPPGPLRPRLRARRLWRGVRRRHARPRQPRHRRQGPAVAVQPRAPGRVGGRGQHGRRRRHPDPGPGRVPPGRGRLRPPAGGLLRHRHRLPAPGRRGRRCRGRGHRQGRGQRGPHRARVARRAGRPLVARQHGALRRPDLPPAVRGRGRRRPVRHRPRAPGLHRPQAHRARGRGARRPRGRGRRRR